MFARRPNPRVNLLLTVMLPALLAMFAVLFTTDIAAAHDKPQTTASPMKRLLIIGEEKGYRHEAVSHAMSTLERLGRETGLWTTTIRTDTEPLTKKKLEYNAKNLNDFDAVLFYTGGTLEMDDQQKADFLSSSTTTARVSSASIVQPLHSPTGPSTAR